MYEKANIIKADSTAIQSSCDVSFVLFCKCVASFVLFSKKRKNEQQG